MAPMYRLSVFTTSGPPSCSLMVVKPARSPNRMVVSRSTPPIESAFGFSASRSTSCGLTRARNCFCMRSFSRWLITATAAVAVTQLLSPASTGAAIGYTMSKRSNPTTPSKPA